MSKETGIELRFVKVTQVRQESTIARYESEYTENLNEVLEARDRFRELHNPTALEFQREDKAVETEEATLIIPTFVWNVFWIHDKFSKPPVIRSEHRDQIPTYPLEEFQVIYQAGE